VKACSSSWLSVSISFSTSARAWSSGSKPWLVSWALASSRLASSVFAFSSRSVAACSTFSCAWPDASCPSVAACVSSVIADTTSASSAPKVDSSSVS
jgi:hypothetical protein